MGPSSIQSLGHLILLADLSSLPDEILQRAIREAARPLPEIRAANIAFLEAARPALGAVSDLGLQNILSESAEASAIFIRSHERILPYLENVSRMEGEDLRRLAVATRSAALAAQMLRAKTNELAEAMKRSLSEKVFTEFGAHFRVPMVS